MTHEGQMGFWPEDDPPPRPPKQKRRNPRGNGAQRRDEGCERVLANEPDESFQEQGMRVVHELARSGVDFTIEDVRDRVTIEPHHPNCWGALMGRVHRLPILRVIGHKKHEFTVANKRLIPIYRGIDKEQKVWRN